MAHSQESDICNMKAKLMECVDSNMKHNSLLLTRVSCIMYHDIRNFCKQMINPDLTKL